MPPSLRLLLASLLLCAHSNAAENSRPHIILIMGDDHGWEEWLSHDNFFDLNPSLSRNGGPPEIIKGESSEILIAQSIRFIEAAGKSGQPFFAVIWFGSPHEPYSGFPADLALYDDLPSQVPEEGDRHLRRGRPRLCASRKKEAGLAGLRAEKPDRCGL